MRSSLLTSPVLRMDSVRCIHPGDPRVKLPSCFGSSMPHHRAGKVLVTQAVGVEQSPPHQLLGCSLSPNHTTPDTCSLPVGGLPPTEGGAVQGDSDLTAGLGESR